MISVEIILRFKDGTVITRCYGNALAPVSFTSALEPISEGRAEALLGFDYIPLTKLITDG